jgi:hypothetical protein
MSERKTPLPDPRGFLRRAAEAEMTALKTIDPQQKRAWSDIARAWMDVAESPRAADPVDKS